MSRRNRLLPQARLLVEHLLKPQLGLSLAPGLQYPATFPSVQTLSPPPQLCSMRWTVGWPGISRQEVLAALALPKGLRLGNCL